MYGKVKPTPTSNKKRAFTLIELMVVIVVIGGIYALVVPPMNKMFSEKTKNEITLSECISFLQNLQAKNTKKATYKIKCTKDFSDCQVLSDEDVVQKLKISMENSEAKIKRYAPTPQGSMKQLSQQNDFFEVVLEKNGIVRPMIYEIESVFYVFSSNAMAGKPIQDKAIINQVYFNSELLPINQGSILAN